jgi:F-type H+-transporting ATPase subunit delta
MADVAAARRYAQAAFDLARARGEIDAWRREIRDVAATLSEPQLARLFGDPKVPLAQKFATLERVLTVSPLVLNLAKLLVRKGRSGYAPAVAEAFDRIADDFEGIAYAQVTTAIALPPDVLAAIEQELSDQFGKKIVATARVDPGVIGGAIIRVGDRLIDGSVRTRLKQLRRQLEGAR